MSYEPYTEFEFVEHEEHRRLIRPSSDQFIRAITERQGVSDGNVTSA